MKLVIIVFSLLLIPKAPISAQVPTPPIRAEQEDKKTKNNPHRIYWDEGLWILGWHEKLRLKIGGQAQIDTAGFAGQEAQPGELEAGTEWRRARLYTNGTIHRRWSFKFQWDFVGGAALKDAWLQFAFKPFGKAVALRGGRFTTSFGLENDGSSSDGLFLEQGMTSAFVPPQETGVLLHSESLNHRWDISFSSAASEFECLICDVVGITGRYSTGINLGRKDRLLHLGGNYSRRWPDKPVKFSVRPESHLAPVFIDNVPIAADRVDTGLVEAAFIQGPFSLQTEYAIAGVKPPNASSQIFDGFYIAGSYSLTGEMRRYRENIGTIRRIRPNRSLGDGSGGLGAFEVALRFSRIDLSGNSTKGEILKNLSFALNWYPTHPSRVSFNLIRAHQETREPVWIFALRLQLAF